jgi:hypothetical protein
LTFSYLVAEGPHDVAFVGRLLGTFGLKRVRLRDKLQPFWTPLIPTTFPFKNDLLKRMPVPAFFESVDYSVAVDSAVGVSRLAPTVHETLAILGSARRELHSIGILLDADWSRQPVATFEELKASLEQSGLAMPALPGIVADADIRTGVFIFPDNQAQGTLENLLDECALVVYPGLREAGRGLVDSIDRTLLTQDDMKELVTPCPNLRGTARWPHAVDFFYDRRRDVSGSAQKELGAAPHGRATSICVSLLSCHITFRFASPMRGPAPRLKSTGGRSTLRMRSSQPLLSGWASLWSQTTIVIFRELMG